MFFCGLDLAWSPRNNSGLSISNEDGDITYTGLVKSDDDIINTITNNIGKEACWISIDAPLIVPNEKGSRPVDKMITKTFRTKHAGCYPANREILLKYGSGRIRGEDLVQMLKKKGFKENPKAKPRSNSKIVFEVFPHPAIVELFSLDMILQYKARKGRDYEFRWNELNRYKKHLAGLSKRDPALKIPKKLTKKSQPTGNAFKNEEDVLDGILCNYLSYYHWYWGTEKNRIFGDTKNGYIVTPISSSLQEWV